MDYIIYTCVSHKKEYVDCVQLLVKTLEKYTKTINFDFLILYDEKLEGKINIESNKIKILTYKPRPIEYSNPEFFYKLRYFDYPNCFKYKKAIYLDADILVTLDISTFFIKNTQENKLYVFPEHKITHKHHEYYYNPFYPRTLPEELIINYETKNIYVFNSGTFLFEINNTMKTHFDNVINLIVNHKKGAFMDQPFFNIYFNRIEATEYMFNQDNYKLGVNKEQFCENCILHFAGQGIGNSMSKFIDMLNYYKKFIVN